MIHRWIGGQMLRNGLNWNLTHREFVLFWRRRSGRRFRLYLRLDSRRHPKGFGVTTDACFYDVDEHGAAVNVRVPRWWPCWLRQPTAPRRPSLRDLVKKAGA